MIGTIRKHSGWLWAVIITATIISFVFWGTNSSKMGTGGGEGVGLGTVYGKKVTPEAYQASKKDFYLDYFFRSGNWPDKASIDPKQIEVSVYYNLMFSQKAEQLGIHVSEDAAAAAASQKLAALGRNGQVVTLDALIQQALGPAGFTAADFEHYVSNELMMQQLIQAVGLSGDLITPEEAKAAYQHDHQELSTQVAFFNTSNYLASVKVTPEIVGQFYTNYEAEYRLPERVQVNYVVFDSTNYIAKSKADWAKTNFNEVVAADLQKVGPNYRGSKTEAEARTKITEELIEGRALGYAKKDANDFAAALFAMDPPKAENLTTVAAQLKVVVHQTSPFAKSTGPDELDTAANFTKAAFELTSDVPVAGPVMDGTAIYVLALAKTLPSMIPPFEEMRLRAATDYHQREATLLAQRAGDSAYHVLTNLLALGHSFPASCVAAGCHPQMLPPFSIGTQELPELGDQATLGQIKQAAFTTPIGKLSNFMPTTEGGFILFVQSKLPVDQSTLAADLPQYIMSLRRERQNEAFQQWYQAEASKALNVPALQAAK